MMLKEKLASDLKDAMRAHNEVSVGVLRLLQAAIQNKEIDLRSKGGQTIGDEAILQVLKQEAKKRKEAAELFIKGGRGDLADKERGELLIIQAYLPAEIGLDEIEKLAKKIIGNAGAKDFGAAMKLVMQELKGKADGKTVGEVIKKILSL